MTRSERGWVLATRVLRWGYHVLVVASVLYALTILTLMSTPVGTMAAQRLMASTPLGELPNADAIVILGGDPFRAADALRVYRAGKAPLIVISGDPAESLPILDAGQIPRSVVRFDTAPLRTMDHPRTIQSIEGIDQSSRLILISSMLHQQRALSVFREAGYHHVWMCSLEWERCRQVEKRRLGHVAVACVIYELAARVKSRLID